MPARSTILAAGFVAALAGCAAVRPNAYTVSRGVSHSGQAEAEGDIVTLTSTCGDSSITGTGRYRWTLSGDRLHFELVGRDECGGRAEHLEDATYERSG